MGGLHVRCWVYVDGFNFYHGIRKHPGCKWVDLLALSRRLRQHDTIDHIKYFTALVENRTDNPGQRTRQCTYWRALATLGCVERINGHFSRWEKFAPLSESVGTLELLDGRGCNVVGVRPIFVKIVRSEEKGSDVNLAAHLVNDAHSGRFDVALVVSSDTDLAGAIRIVTHEIGRPVHVCKPRSRGRSRLLNRAATSVFRLDPRDLRVSLFSNTLTDANGSFSKPTDW